MTDSRVTIDQEYDPVILDAAWSLRESFLFPGESEDRDKFGFYLTAWNSGDELSPGIYNIVEWWHVYPNTEKKTETALGVWITELCKFSPTEELRENPKLLVSAIIDICLQQSKLWEDEA